VSKTTEYVCENCIWSGDNPVPLVGRVHERFEVGDTYTDSECPECGSLVHPSKDESSSGSSGEGDPKGKTENNDCLDGLRCPECKALEPFQISSMCQAVWTDDGVGDTYEFEYDKASYISCLECGHGGQVQEFEDHDLEAEDDDAEGED
jgi:ssDNA-binding Zn-finger/Zn-ribbon topoisomerase 1